MLSFKAFLYLITICVACVKSQGDETVCKSDYRDKNNNPINIKEYCSNKLCIEKCCGPGQMLRSNNTCVNITTIIKKIENNFPHAVTQFKSINVLSSLDVDKTSKNKVDFIQNLRDFRKCTAERTDAKHYVISEDGSLWWQNIESNKWNKISKLKYCMDYKVHSFRKPDNQTDVEIKIVIWPFTISAQDTKLIESFEVVGVSISSFFLVLVLLVYCLLPELRNLFGLVLMAYTFSLLLAFVTKLILTFVKKNPPGGFCRKFSPVVYFFFLSSIFWLSVISADVWWTLRDFRSKRGSRRGELLKFMWYNLYAWGIPLLITAIVTTLDSMPYLDIVEPPFKDCLMDGISYDYYFKIPTGILVFFNMVLFVITVYHMWTVKRSVYKCQDSRTSKQQNYKFSTYAKLFLIMGVGWCLDLVPAALDKLWFYILLNLYNLLTGLTIFFLFVFKKNILVKLCKRFNIRNEFIKKMEQELSLTKSGFTRTSGVPSSIVRNRPKDQETDLFKNCPKEESVVAPL